MTPPRVSIVLPVYNRLRFLREAVGTVFAQTFQDWELIIADDGSDAQTQEFLTSIEAPPRVRVLRLEHTGNPGAVRNAALQVARATRVAFLDSDDYWLPGKLERQLAMMDATPGCRWSHTMYSCVDAEGAPLPYESKPYCGAIFEPILTMHAHIALPTVIAERAFLAEAGDFDTDQLQHGDYELWLRLVVRSDLHVLEEPLACIRNHREHYTRGGLWALRWKRRMYEKMQGLVRDPEHVRAVRRARARNAASLMRAHSLAGERRAALNVLTNSVGYCWWRPRWVATAALALLPGVAGRGVK